MILTPAEQELARYGAENVQDEIIDTTRWGVIHAITFERDGELWQFTTEDPATEMQDWVECDITAYRVVPVREIRYRKAPEG